MNRSALNNSIATWDLDELNPKDFINEFKRIFKSAGSIFNFISYYMIGKWHTYFDDEIDTLQFFIKTC